MKTDWTHELPVGGINALLIGEYLTSHGWKEVASQRQGLLVFEGPKDDDGEPIIQVIPRSAEAPDFGMRARELVSALSVIEDRRAGDVLRDIMARQGSISHGSERNALETREEPSFPKKLFRVAVAASLVSLMIAVSAGAVSVVNEVRYRQVYGDLHTLRDELSQQQADLAAQKAHLATREAALQARQQALEDLLKKLMNDFNTMIDQKLDELKLKSAPRSTTDTAPPAR